MAALAALGACTQDPSPEDPTSGETTADSGDTTASASSDSTAAASEGSTAAASEGSTGLGSTGPVPEPESTDCDALREQGECEALSGADFQCVWFPEAYPAMLDGSSCTIGEPIGWCVAAYTIGDTGCVEDVQSSCADDTTVEDLFVREAEDGTIVLIQDMVLEGLDYGCGQPVLWDACNAGEGPAACACGCDPGLPQ